MNYKLQSLKIDLGTTPIENIFINNFLHFADGNAVKVYLYAYKLAYDQNNSSKQPHDITQELGMSQEEVEEAFDFWIEQGIVQKDEEGSYVFLSLRELFLGITQHETPQAAKVEPQQMEAVVELTNRQMFDRVEEVLETKLTPNEIMKILEHREEFHQQSDLIAYGFVYCRDKTSKRNVNYVISVLRNWAIDGILTMQDLQVMLEEKESTKAKRTNTAKPKKKALTNTAAPSDVTGDALRDILNRKLQEDIERAMGDEKSR